MKKIIGVVVFFSILMGMVVPLQSQTIPEITQVIADQIDNRVLDEPTQVVVHCANTQFTQTGVNVNLIGTNRAQVSDIQVIDDTTFSFKLLMPYVEPGRYDLEVWYRTPIGTRVTIMGNSTYVMVRKGHLIFEQDHMTHKQIQEQGITVKMVNNEIVDQLTIRMDGHITQITKVMSRVFRIYPEPYMYENKDQVEIKVEGNNTFYTKTFHVDQRNFTLSPDHFTPTQSKIFYIDSHLAEFPMNTDQMSIYITGQGRYIKVDDITRIGTYRIRVRTPFYLSYGSYQLHMDWPTLSQEETLGFSVVRSTEKSDMALDESIKTFLHVRRESVHLTLHDEQALRYIESNKKEIDISHIPYEEFTLSIPNRTLSIIKNANVDLKVVLYGQEIVIRNNDLHIGNDMDLYLYIRKQDFAQLPSQYFSIAKPMYYDANVPKMTIRRIISNNVYDYSKVKTLYQDRYEQKNMLGTLFLNGRAEFIARDDGFYGLVLEGMNFTDVPSNHWANIYINGLSALSIVEGTGYQRFLPEQSVTHAQFAKMIALSIGLNMQYTGHGFLDVSLTHWAYGYVCALESANIIDGQYFRPDQEISRKDMAKMAVRAYEYVTNEQASRTVRVQFYDIIQLEEQEQRYIHAAYNLGLINGMSTNVYAPSANSTRAQSSAVIYRLIEKTQHFH